MARGPAAAHRRARRGGQPGEGARDVLDATRELRRRGARAGARPARRREPPRAGTGGPAPAVENARGGARRRPAPTRTRAPAVQGRGGSHVAERERVPARGEPRALARTRSRRVVRADPEGLPRERCAARRLQAPRVGTKGSIGRCFRTQTRAEETSRILRVRQAARSAFGRRRREGRDRQGAGRGWRTRGPVRGRARRRARREPSTGYTGRVAVGAVGRHRGSPGRQATAGRGGGAAAVDAGVLQGHPSAVERGADVRPARYR
mmetsp:Transcript_976/g.4396  ORF Transcript_976/g.4396 Transcript_976/m.4396 type:complete len:264 (+) Transcript_976:186-977(+)